MFINKQIFLGLMAQFEDIVFPAGNEEQFEGYSKKLGISNLIFCYTLNNLPKYFAKNSDSKKLGLIAAPYDILKAKSKQLPILCNKNDRHIFEQHYNEKYPLIVFGLEGIYNKDSLHSRHSGLNHILCELAHKNNIILGFSLSQLLASNNHARPYIIGRMMQNIRLARKYKVKIKLASFSHEPIQMRSYNDMVSLGVILGMQPSESKRALADIIY